MKTYLVIADGAYQSAIEADTIQDALAEYNHATQIIELTEDVLQQIHTIVNDKENARALNSLDILPPDAHQ